MSKSGRSPAAPIWRREPHTDNTRVVYVRRRVQKKWVSSRTLLPSTETAVANSLMPSDILVEGEISGLGTVHTILTVNFLCMQLIPLFKRKMLSSIMDGLQKREKRNQKLNTTPVMLIQKKYCANAVLNLKLNTTPTVFNH